MLHSVTVVAVDIDTTDVSVVDPVTAVVASKEKVLLIQSRQNIHAKCFLRFFFSSFWEIHFIFLRNFAIDIAFDDTANIAATS